MVHMTGARTLSGITILNRGCLKKTVKNVLCIIHEISRLPISLARIAGGGECVGREVLGTCPEYVD
jgi:hypothetical protein